jgi:hypothetical protein
MLKEQCAYEPPLNPCNIRQKGKSCSFYPTCTILSNPENGNLALSQFQEKHPKLQTSQIARACKELMESSPDIPPLELLNNILSERGFYILPKGTCLWEGKDGRAIKCPNIPGSKIHFEKICKDCVIYPEVARMPKKTS